MKSIDIDEILNTLKEERRVLMENQASLYGKFSLLDKLIQYYTELKEEEDKVSKK
jgi:hypothetical protein